MTNQSLLTDTTEIVEFLRAHGSENGVPVSCLETSAADLIERLTKERAQWESVALTFGNEVERLNLVAAELTEALINAMAYYEKLGVTQPWFPGAQAALTKARGGSAK